MTWRRIAHLFGALLIASGLAACTDDPPPDTGANTAPVIAPGRPGEPASTIAPGQASAPAATPPNEADVSFVQDMIVHHQQAIEMTMLVPERATDERVRGLADRIAGSQGPEIDMMNGWLRQRGKPTVETSASGGHGGHTGHAGMPGMAAPEQLTALRAATGAEFDRLFLQLMITHHEGALTMARQVQTTGVDVRVQEIADDIIATQAAEIRRMRGMLGG